MAVMQSGDTMVVTKLDRMARSATQGIELVQKLLVERAQEGKAIAKLNPDFREGRPKKFSKAQIAHAPSLLADHSYKEVSEMTGVSKSTLIRANRKR